MKPYTTKMAASSVTVGTMLWSPFVYGGYSYVFVTRQEWKKSQYLGCWINGTWYDRGTFVDVVVGASTK